jgi:hypothetical protein
VVVQGIAWKASLSSLIEILLALVSIALSAAAAYFAYRNYQRRPKLKFYIGDEDNQVMYSEKDPDRAYVHATIANVGKITAHNVVGRIEFEQGRVRPEKRIPTASGSPNIDQHITAHSGNWATLHLGSLAVSRRQATGGDLHAKSFEASPGHFVIPVRVLEEGQTQLSYWFVSDETDGIEDAVTLHFPKRTTS